MNFFGTKRATAPDAQALADQVAAKLATARTALSEADAQLAMLGLQFELPDTGIIVSEADLEKATAARDAARAVVDRVSAAQGEALRRLEEAKTIDAAAALDARWGEVSARRDRAQEALTEWTEKLHAAERAGRKYLAQREELARTSPASADRFPGGANALIQQGIDRGARVVELIAMNFHTRITNAIAPELATEVQRERDALNALGERELKVEPAPPPPTPKINVFGSGIPAVGHAVKDGKAA